MGPAGGRLSLQEGEAAARAEAPAAGGVVPMHHPALPSRPPQRRAGLGLPHWGQVPAPCVGEAGAAGVRPGARVKRTGVPPLEGLADSGPLGPKLGPPVPPPLHPPTPPYTPLRPRTPPPRRPKF